MDTLAYQHDCRFGFLDVMKDTPLHLQLEASSLILPGFCSASLWDESA